MFDQSEFCYLSPTEGWTLPLREPEEGTAYGEKVRAEQKCLGSCPIHVGAVAEP